MNKTTRSAALGAATALALAAAPPAASADEYQFIVADNSDNRPPASFATTATSLETGQVRKGTTATTLEARYRSEKETDCTGFRSDKFTGFYIIVR